MTTKTDKQGREAFDAWAGQFDQYSSEYQDMGADEYFIAGYRAALQSQSMPFNDWFDMFMELARAVVVANRLFAVSPTTTKQKAAADAAIALQKHARKHPALQSQDARLQAVAQAVADALTMYERYGEVCPFEGEPMIHASTLVDLGELAREAIGHARRVEGEGE